MASPTICGWTGVRISECHFLLSFCLLTRDDKPFSYAGVTFSNEPKNRKLLIAWMSNWNYGEVVPTEEWRGQMTIPRVLELKRVDGRVRLASSPAEELELLRIASQFYERTQPLIIESGKEYDLTSDLSFGNPLLEIDAEFDTNLNTRDPSASFQLCFFNSLNEEVCLGYDYGKNSIYLDRTKSGNVSFETNFGQKVIAKRESRSKIVQFKIYLDTSAIEIFGDGGVTAMTALFYPTEQFSYLKIAFNSANSNNELSVRSISVRGLQSIYNC